MPSPGPLSGAGSQMPALPVTLLHVPHRCTYLPPPQDGRSPCCSQIPHSTLALPSFNQLITSLLIPLKTKKLPEHLVFPQRILSAARTLVFSSAPPNSSPTSCLVSRIPSPLFHPQILVLSSLPSLTCHQYGRQNDAPSPKSVHVLIPGTFKYILI